MAKSLKMKAKRAGKNKYIVGVSNYGLKGTKGIFPGTHVKLHKRYIYSKLRGESAVMRWVLDPAPSMSMYGDGSKTYKTLEEAKKAAFVLAKKKFRKLPSNTTKRRVKRKKKNPAGLSKEQALLVGAAVGLFLRYK